MSMFFVPPPTECINKKVQVKHNGDQDVNHHADEREINHVHDITDKSAVTVVKLGEIGKVEEKISVESHNQNAVSEVGCSEPRKIVDGGLEGEDQGAITKGVIHSVELLKPGSLVVKKPWFSKQAIYPRGFKSRVRFLSVLDPTKLTNYVCEVLDAGLLGPLFRVSVEECPTENFSNVSAEKCWQMVVQRLKLEIIKKCEQPVSSLTSLKSLDSINGLDMFGFLSPHIIIQVVEALDPKHQLEEYWSQRSAKVFGVELTKEGKKDNTEKGGASDPSSDRDTRLLRGLLKKATPEELVMMHGLLCGETRNTDLKEELSSLVDKMEERSP